MNAFFSKNWLTLVILILATSFLLLVAYFVKQTQDQNATLAREQIEVQKRELELKEQEQKRLIEIEQLKEQRAAEEASERARQDELATQKNAAASVAEKKKRASVNQCIDAAQKERDRRKANTMLVWTSCIQDPLFTPEECEKYRDHSVVEAKYVEWEANCNRGIENRF